MRKLLSLLFFCLFSIQVFCQQFKVGASVEIEWNGKWYPGKILEIKGEKYYVSYDGYNAEWNEYVSASRLREKTVNTNNTTTTSTTTSTTNSKDAIPQDTSFLIGVETIWEIAVSPDKKWIAAASAYGNVRLLKSSDMSIAHKIDLGTDPLYSIDFSYDGKYLIVGGKDVVILSTSTGAILTRIPEIDGVSRLRCSPIDNTVYISAAPKSNYLMTYVAQYEIPSGKRLKTIRAEVHNQDAVISGMALSDDGKTIALGISNKAKGIELYETASGKLMRKIKTNADVTDLDLSPDGKKIISGGIDKKGHLWDSGTGALLRTFAWGQDYISGVSFSPDGQSVAICGRGTGAQVKVFNVSNGNLEKSFGTVNPCGNAVKFLSNRLVLVALTTYGDIARVMIIAKYGW
jgi:WD40 repeat protein